MLRSLAPIKSERPSNEQSSHVRRTADVSVATGLLSIGSTVLLAMIPKCPACFAAHSAILAALGLGTTQLMWARAFFAGVLLASIFLVVARSSGRRRVKLVLLSGAAALVVFLMEPSYLPDGRATAFAAMLLALYWLFRVLTARRWSQTSCRSYQRLTTDY